MTRPRSSDSPELAAFKQGVADFPRRNRHPLQAAYDRGYHAAGDEWDAVRPDREERQAGRARLSAANIGEVCAAVYRGN